jgi:hypothetical protein
MAARLFSGAWLVTVGDIETYAINAISAVTFLLTWMAEPRKFTQC